MITLLIDLQTQYYKGMLELINYNANQYASLLKTVTMINSTERDE